MTAGRDLLRQLWGAGVRVALADDRFRLTPGGVAPEELRDLLKEYRAEVTAVLEQLPAAGRCPICGDPNGWADVDGSMTAHCVTCVQVAIDQFLATSDISSKGAAA